jgi:hypothetical protein
MTRVRCKSEENPFEANELMRRYKDLMRSMFEDHELEEINRLRRSLTRVIKEFNMHQTRWLARLLVLPCDPLICKDKRSVFFEAIVDTRDCTWTVGSIVFTFDLEPVKSANLMEISANTSFPGLSSSVVYDIISLALKLMNEFYSTVERDRK